jgi:hypothetical protein
LVDRSSGMNILHASAAEPRGLNHCEDGSHPRLSVAERQSSPAAAAGEGGTRITRNAAAVTSFT